jgi:type IX secretion system PorP/SprF family membrane protein
LKTITLKISIGLFVTALSLSLFGQNSQFSQFYSSPTNLGPSFAGITGGSRVIFNFRDQWPSIPGTFLTYSASFDQYFPKLKSGFGLLMYRDQAGSGNLAHTRFGLQYAYDVEINRYIKFRPGIMFSYQRTSIDFYKLVFGDGLKIDGGYDPTIVTPPLPSKGYIDFTTSMLFYGPKFWGGMTFDHLLQPDESLRNEIESKIPLKFSLYGGYKFTISADRRNRINENIIVTLLYKMQASSDQFDVGAYWEHEPFSMGLWIRGLPGFMKSAETYGNLDALVVLLGYKFKNVKIGYSYDFTISDLIGTTGGAHEISLVYEFQTSFQIKNNRKHSTVPCPVF